MIYLRTAELVFAARAAERFPAYARALLGLIRAADASAVITSEMTTEEGGELARNSWNGPAVHSAAMAEESETIRIPPNGTRGAGGPPGSRLLMAIFKPMMDRQLKRVQNAKGPEQPEFMGFPVLTLTTVGAKTGQERTHVLGGFTDGNDAWLVVASKGGAATHPGWFYNIARHPDQVWAHVGKRKFKARVQSLQGEERRQAYARVVAVAPRYGNYLTKTDREIPVLRVTPE